MKQKKGNTNTPVSNVWDGGYTKGKWERYIQPAENGLVSTINVGSKRIATLSFVGIAETEENAMLITSAPLLLEACKRALETGLLDDLSQSMLNEAIGKATVYY